MFADVASPPSRKRGSNNLFLRLWPFIFVAIAQFLTASASLYMVSNVRAYVAGESLWSKGQRDAIYFLNVYADTGDNKYYRRFQEALAIPLGDLNARLSLERPDRDYAAAARGFRQGGNHPDDIGGMINLLVYCRHLPYFSDAVEKWQATDGLLLELQALGWSVESIRRNAVLSSSDINELEDKIDTLRERIGPLAVAFSDSLGCGSRAINVILFVTNFLTMAGLIALITWHLRNLLTQRQEFENALFTEKERVQRTLASVGEAVIRVDAQGRVEYMNTAAERLVERTQHEAAGTALSSLFQIFEQSTTRERRELFEMALQHNSTGCRAFPDLLLRTPSTSTPVSIVATRVMNYDHTSGVVLVIHDMTREQEHIDHLSWQASHDMLTGLANRREFERRLEMALHRLDQLQGPHALMFIDLDKFKPVNDSCGHEAGDDLLRRITDELRKQMRAEDLLARLGGDEFAILIENCDLESAMRIAENARLAVESAPFEWGGRSFGVTLSIGLVSVKRPGTTKEEALRAADSACYSAKRGGRNQLAVYERMVAYKAAVGM